MTELISCRETYERMCQMTAGGRPVRNVHFDILLDPWLVETELFPQEALAAYSAWNLEHEIAPALRQKYFSAHRGGSQGDYRAGMGGKIANVVDCLTEFPASKRAVITVANNPCPSHRDDADAKCLREIHLYRDGAWLNATAFFRAQAAEIFPKNIHFIGELVAEIAGRLDDGLRPGQLHYLTTILVADRW